MAMSGGMPPYAQNAIYGAGQGTTPSAGMAGSGFGQLGAGLANMLFPGENPYDKASPYFQQIPDILKQYMNPYINAGQGAMGQLQGQYGQLVNDPGAMMQKIGAGYKQSPGYQFQLNQGLGAAGNAAASGGMLGSQQHQQQAATVSEGLANQDYYNYLSKALGMYGTGLQGLGDINKMGYGASTGLASGLMGNLQNQGAMAYANQAD